MDLLPISYVVCLLRVVSGVAIYMYHVLQATHVGLYILLLYRVCVCTHTGTVLPKL